MWSQGATAGARSKKAAKIEVRWQGRRGEAKERSDDTKDRNKTNETYGDDADDPISDYMSEELNVLSRGIRLAGKGSGATCMARLDRYREARVCCQEARTGKPHGIGKACVEGL